MSCLEGVYMSDFHDWFYGYVDNPEAEKEEDKTTRAASAETQPAIIQQALCQKRRLIIGAAKIIINACKKLLRKPFIGGGAK